MIKDRNEKQDSLALDCGGQLGIVQFTESRVCSNFFQGKNTSATMVLYTTGVT